MAKTRVLPGVEVSVVKEVVPPLPTPSGVVGIVGVTDAGPNRPTHVASYTEFKEIFGRASAYSMPEAKQVLQNGAFELVVVKVNDAQAAKARVVLLDSDGAAAVILDARATGSWGNDISVKVRENKEDTTVKSVDITVAHKDVVETFRNLVMKPPEDRKYLFDVINGESTLVTAIDARARVKVPGPLARALIVEDGLILNDVGAVPVLKLTPKQEGAGHEAEVILETDGTTTLKIYKSSGARVPSNNYKEISMDPDSDKYVVRSINEDPKSLVLAEDLPGGITNFPAGIEEPVLLGNGEEIVSGLPNTPGRDPGKKEFNNAIDQLEGEPDVDAVLASLQKDGYEGVPDATPQIPPYAGDIHAHIASHCERMSKEAKNRIGFGTIKADDSGNIGLIKSKAALLNSDRFVLLAPHGILGAVAGRIASLRYFDSPTFKRVLGISELEYYYSPSELRQLVLGNVLVLELKRARGIIMEKGIATDGSQISVTRVADHAVRETKKIADLFIGTLHNADNRMALKQRIIGMHTQMEREGAIVPSVDGTEPAFLVDVYASQEDFAMGICRVDIAVRPVRAIDYIYATILVKI